ncbi:MAG TPA: sulfotransferase [Bacillota bacterium]|nr:sulfotransferase [Bacillota bacterium]
MDLLLASATHRSGSTLLQRMFNARKETLIWGENGGCLSAFCNIYRQALYYAEHSKDARGKYFNNGEDPNHWIATMTPPQKSVTESLIHSVKIFHERLYKGRYGETHDLIGYKEVRYGYDELTLFRICYPKAPIILLVRNPVDVWKSVSQNAKVNRYQSVKKFASMWNHRVKSFIHLSDTDSNIYLIRYEDLIRKNKATMNVIKQVGKITDDQIEKVLSVKISSSVRPIPAGQEHQIRRQCQVMSNKMGYRHG